MAVSLWRQFFGAPTLYRRLCCDGWTDAAEGSLPRDAYVGAATLQGARRPGALLAHAPIHPLRASTIPPLLYLLPRAVATILVRKGFEN